MEGIDMCRRSLTDRFIRLLPNMLDERRRALAR